MTTENGFISAAKARKYITTITNRATYLQTYIDQKLAEGMNPSFAKSEMYATLWAIPILEAEWDNLARMERELTAVESVKVTKSHRTKTLVEQDKQ